MSDDISKAINTWLNKAEVGLAMAYVIIYMECADSVDKTKQLKDLRAARRRISKVKRRLKECDE